MEVETKRVFIFDDGSELVVPQHVEDFVCVSLARTNAHEKTSVVIDAIKFLRAEYGLSLKNAKELADYWRGTIAGTRGLYEKSLGELLRDKLDNAA